MSQISLPRSSRILATTITADDRDDQLLTDISHLMSELGATGIEGPIHMRLDFFGTVIGSGAQFDVYKVPINLHSARVYKRIKLPEFSSSLPKATELRVHYRTIQLEIASLCDPVRRLNPNVVRVLGWGFDDFHGDMSHLIPFLQVERAICSLDIALSNRTIETAGRKAFNIHHHLCLDIASGVQAIHHAGLAHGDLKPSNVLIFAQDYPNVPFIAKLSDFGHCIILRHRASTYRSYRGTVGWLPPEIIGTVNVDTAVESHIFTKCDAYTYGLLTLSVFLNSGKSLVSYSKSANAALSADCCSRIEKLDLLEDLKQKLIDIAVTELASMPQIRRDICPDLLDCDVESFHNWYVSKYT